MNFDTLKNSTVLLFGKSRSLAGDEFVKLLSQHDITLVSEVSEDLGAILIGRLVTPIEQDELDRLYLEKRGPMIEIDAFEAWLCRSIDADNLLMSLKLSGDKERLMVYLQNPYISNALFLRLLLLYNWENEGFFENDENRDITAALISRFYENIERNHNVQYANMGIMHLLNQSDNSELLETIALLQPLQNALKDGCDNSTQKILNAIALHPNTSVKVLKQWLKKGNSDIQSLIAMRHDLSGTLQQFLLNLNIPLIHEVLSLNAHIDKSTSLVLMETFPENISKHIDLDEVLFEQLKENYSVDLAENSTLTEWMQQELVSGDESVQKVLAKNSTILDETFERLYKEGSDVVLLALTENSKITQDQLTSLYEAKSDYFAAAIAANEKSDVILLENLSTSSDVEVLLALAKNPATPVDLLYQFQLDGRLARAVKENASFGKHIQRNNIGWDV